jgi:predicted ATPase
MKIKVEKIAKIDEANVEIRDLTVFVGKNSTNKSYMAHTIYMLNKILSYSISSEYRFGLFNQYINKYDTKIKDILKIISFEEEKIKDKYTLEDTRKVIFDFKNIDIESFLKGIYNFIIADILNKINLSFNTKKEILKEIYILDYKVTIQKIFRNNKISIINKYQESDFTILLSKIFMSTMVSFGQQKIAKKEFYFPASRTGFVLAFDEIVSGVLRDRFGGKPINTKLTEPTINFISGFGDIKAGKFNDDYIYKISKNEENYSKEKLRKLFKFIEKRIVKGKIIEDKNSQNYTQFFLETDSKEKLDLHLSSSATVELLPLIIFLKHFSKIDDRLLVIEEPEAHLHPKAQIEMARLLVMLVNAGAKVLITTHSDYILNELSNCIKLNQAEDKFKKEYLQKYKLDKDTIISANRVSAYLFKDINNKKIEVQELVIDEYGIANDNFDDILDELLERTDEINSMVL